MLPGIGIGIAIAVGIAVGFFDASATIIVAIFVLKSDSDCDCDTDADQYETFMEKELGPSIKDKRLVLPGCQPLDSLWRTVLTEQYPASDCAQPIQSTIISRTYQVCRGRI
jgi:hypothetical protein